MTIQPRDNDKFKEIFRKHCGVLDDIEVLLKAEIPLGSQVEYKHGVGVSTGIVIGYAKDPFHLHVVNSLSGRDRKVDIFSQSFSLLSVPQPGFDFHTWYAKWRS